MTFRIRKAKQQESFKCFQDLGLELFDNKTMDSIVEFFTMEKKDYNGFRSLDFGSCEILSTGEGRELTICKKTSVVPDFKARKACL